MHEQYEQSNPILDVAQKHITFIAVVIIILVFPKGKKKKQDDIDIVIT